MSRRFKFRSWLRFRVVTFVQCERPPAAPQKR
ncbi:Protein of unknown function [Gryllus bimaculatus]|nr:Protein of unknown function [Gryllus bimaculatus]